MHVQSTFIITVTAVVTNTKHTRTRSVSLSISFLGAPAPGASAGTQSAALDKVAVAAMVLSQITKKEPASEKPRLALDPPQDAVGLLHALVRFPLSDRCP